MPSKETHSSDIQIFLGGVIKQSSFLIKSRAMACAVPAPFLFIPMQCTPHVCTSGRRRSQQVCHCFHAIHNQLLTKNTPRRVVQAFPGSFLSPEHFFEQHSACHSRCHSPLIKARADKQSICLSGQTADIRHSIQRHTILCCPTCYYGGIR